MLPTKRPAPGSPLGQPPSPKSVRLEPMELDNAEYDFKDLRKQLAHISGHKEQRTKEDELKADIAALKKQTEDGFMKLEQAMSAQAENYEKEVEELKSRIKSLEHKVKTREKEIKDLVQRAFPQSDVETIHYTRFSELCQRAKGPKRSKPDLCPDGGILMWDMSAVEWVRQINQTKVKLVEKGFEHLYGVSLEVLRQRYRTVPMEVHEAVCMLGWLHSQSEWNLVSYTVREDIRSVCKRVVQDWGNWVFEDELSSGPFMTDVVGFSRVKALFEKLKPKGFQTIPQR